MIFTDHTSAYEVCFHLRPASHLFWQQMTNIYLCLTTVLKYTWDAVDCYLMVVNVPHKAQDCSYCRSTKLNKILLQHWSNGVERVGMIGLRLCPCDCGCMCGQHPLFLYLNQKRPKMIILLHKYFVVLLLPLVLYGYCAISTHQYMTAVILTVMKRVELYMGFLVVQLRGL